MSSYFRSRPWRKPNKEINNSGFVLPLVVIAGLIIAAGAMATSTRLFAGLVGSIRQGQSRQAQQAAETGITTILASLNRDYPYLLINKCEVGKDYEPATDCTGWKEGNSPDNLRLITSVCSGTNPNPPSNLESLITGTVKSSNNNPTAKYQLISYQFIGDTQQGGEAIIKVKGEALAGTFSRSTAVIEQTVPILPKNCNVPINTPSDQSSFAGLLGSDDINLGNNDLTGNINANVFCLYCDPSRTRNQLLTDIRGNNGSTGQMQVGPIYAGPIALPSVRSFPGNPSSAFRALVIKDNFDIVAGHSNGGACTVIDGVTHCRVKCISLAGQKEIKVWTNPLSGPSSGPSSNLRVPQSANKGVQLYFDYTNDQAGIPDLLPGTQIESCSSGVVSMGGQTKIYQSGYSNPSLANPVNLSMFGLPAPANSAGPSQSFVIGGGSSVSAFVYFPDGRFTINGSGDGGDSDEVIGAVWTRVYDGAAGNKINIRVPDNMGRLLYERFGLEYSLGIREFTAVGTNRWQLYQLPNI